MEDVRMACTNLTIGEKAAGFTISASKTKEKVPFYTDISISYPAKPNETVSLVKAIALFPDSCFMDVKLDNVGKATAKNFQVTENLTLYAIHGLGCCFFVLKPPGCTESNRIDLGEKPMDWGTIALWGVGLLAAAYIVGQLIGGKR